MGRSGEPGQRRKLLGKHSPNPGFDRPPLCSSRFMVTHFPPVRLQQTPAHPKPPPGLCLPLPLTLGTLLPRAAGPPGRAGPTPSRPALCPAAPRDRGGEERGGSGPCWSHGGTARPAAAPRGVGAGSAEGSRGSAGRAARPRGLLPPRGSAGLGPGRAGTAGGSDPAPSGDAAGETSEPRGRARLPESPSRGARGAGRGQPALRGAATGRGFAPRAPRQREARLGTGRRVPAGLGERTSGATASRRARVGVAAGTGSDNRERFSYPDWRRGELKKTKPPNQNNTPTPTPLNPTHVRGQKPPDLTFWGSCSCLVFSIPKEYYSLWPIGTILTFRPEQFLKKCLGTS